MEIEYFLDNQNWRYATKFDLRKIRINLDKHKAVRLSASSYGLQLYKVIMLKIQN
jgi:hypothetical protein